MEDLNLKIVDNYIFNVDEANKSQCIENHVSNLPKQTMQIPIHSIVEKIKESPTRPEGPPEKVPKIQVSNKSEWSPLKLPGIPDLGDKNMQFPVKSVKEKITKLFTGEPLTPSPEWSSEGSPEKLTGSSDLPNQTLQISGESVAKVDKIFPVKLPTPLSEKLAGLPDSFTALQKLEDDLDYEEDSENEDTNSLDNQDIFGPDLRNQTSQIPVKSGNVEEILEMFHVELWGARTFKDELELIRKKFRKCRVGM